MQIVCKEPSELDLATLATNEFYKNTVKVSAPKIAPETTTLANFPNIAASDTHAYVESAGITLAQVRIKFIPVSFRWNWGDETHLDTTDPGKAYDPNVDIPRVDDVEKMYPVTHRYRTLGTFAVTVTVTFAGQYSINGGAWNDIDGTLEATSPPHSLLVKEARSQFVSAED